MYVCVCIYIYTHTYIYIERERDRHINLSNAGFLQRRRRNMLHTMMVLDTGSNTHNKRGHIRQLAFDKECHPSDGTEWDVAVSHASNGLLVQSKNQFTETSNDLRVRLMC